MKTMKTINQIIRTLLIIIFLAACGAEEVVEATAEENAVAARNAAVTAYLTGNYQTALDQFALAFSYGATTVQEEVAAGVGFSLLKLQRFAEADSAYTAALVAFPDNTDALAMGVLLSYAEDDYASCITLADVLLALDANYELSFYAELNADDIVLHKALSQFKLSDYAGSYATMLTIDASPGFLADDPDMINKLADRLETLVGNLSD